MNVGWHRSLTMLSQFFDSHSGLAPMLDSNVGRDVGLLGPTLESDVDHSIHHAAFLAHYSLFTRFHYIVLYISVQFNVLQPSFIHSYCLAAPTHR